ncbi:MAG: glycoside hydrolase family 78 protein [Planctomycetes bacterium]|nr:glycoside hydrolase family 78 protein [Planctomycetota bacterium]
MLKAVIHRQIFLVFATVAATAGINHAVAAISGAAKTEIGSQIPAADQIKPGLSDRFRSASTKSPFLLRCDWRRKPLGVQAPHPLLTWSSPQRAALRRIVAYEIQVAASTGDLLRSPFIWDSGKIAVRRSFLPQYSGPSFKPFTWYYWRVRVWGNGNWKSRWSRPASWMTGPLKTADWRGHWISYYPRITNPFYTDGFNAHYGIPLPLKLAQLPEPVSFNHAAWILPVGAARPGSVIAPVGLYMFSRTFSLPHEVEFSRCFLVIAGDNVCKVAINGHVILPHFSAPWSTPAVLEVDRDLRGGLNKIDVLLQNQGAAPNPSGLIAKLYIRGNNNFSRHVVTNAKWSGISTSTGAKWISGVPRQNKVTVVAPWGRGPWGRIAPRMMRPKWRQNEPCPIFRKLFHVPAHTNHAYLYMAGLGFWKVLINGHKVGHGELESTLYDYSKTVPYQAFDVTRLLRKGHRNVMSISLGNGWFNVMEDDAWNWNKAPWRAWPRVRMNLLMRTVGGKSTWLATNNTWQAAAGPRLADGVYNGEVYDAALEIDGWNNPQREFANYPHAAVAKAPAGRLTAQLMPSCRVMQQMAPLSISEPEPHVFVVKFPQNMSGWMTLTARGRPGVPVVMKYGERLYPNGLVNQSTIKGLVFTGSFQTDTYIPIRGNSFTYHPQFTYNGFQYVQINGLQSRRDIIRATADFIYTPFHRAGEFWSANPLINAIADATNRSYCSNFVGRPTDCPTREKNGWTGDTWLAAVQGMFTYNNQLGYAMWLNDFRDDQTANGSLAVIIPTSNGWGQGDAVDWDTAYEFVTWYQYLYQGDGEMLESHYQGIRKYFLYTLGHTKNWILPNSCGVGEWASPSTSRPPVSFTSTCILYRDAVLLARFARILGKTTDARRFQEDAAAIKAAVNAKFYRGNGLYSNGDQTALCMPLYYGLVPKNRQADVVDQLVADIHKHNNHLDVGILGERCLFRVLSRYNHTALAYRIATQTTYPSYGQWILHGATTLWEGWGLHPGSMNHIMFGDILGWFYNDLAGIEPDWRSPGFRTIIINPHPVKTLPWAWAKYNSRFGQIKSGWRWHGKQLELNVTIPPASSAMMALPGTRAAKVTCNGQPFGGIKAKPPALPHLAFRKNVTWVHLGPGSYRFVYAPHGLE